jgi:hypothetical protein
MVNVESPEREFRTFQFFICNQHLFYLFDRVAFLHIVKNILDIFIVFYFLD